MHIRVEDTGIGIPADKLSTIFDKFTQADSSVNRRFGGTGLGLAITKALRELMGGRISVGSEPGRGSVFTVCVPLQLAAEQLSEETETVTQAIAKVVKTKQRPTVLLVEDYLPNILVATSFLDNFGYETEVADDGLAAIEKFKSAGYAAILMDVQMAGMNGLDATMSIRRHEMQNGLKRTPIIGMTAHALAGDRERCVAAGMDDYIAKPFDPAILEEMLQKAIRLHKP